MRFGPFTHRTATHAPPPPASPLRWAVAAWLTPWLTFLLRWWDRGWSSVRRSRSSSFPRYLLSPLLLTGCPGRPPQPLLFCPSSAPYLLFFSRSLDDDPPASGLFGRCHDVPAWRKTSNQHPASYRGPLACHWPLPAAALVRGFPALVLRLRLRYKDLPPRFFRQQINTFLREYGVSLAKTQ